MKILSAMVICLAALGCIAPSTDAAEYPNRPIELVIPFEAGSGTDIFGRFLADSVEKELGVKFVVNNKPGGAGATAYTYVKNSRPDGYVIGMFNSTLASHKTFGTLPFDHDDVGVVIIVQTSPSVLCVPSESMYKTLEDVIEDAKNRAGQITWATVAGNVLSSARDFWHSAGGLHFKVVPFANGGIQAVTQTSGGHMDLCFVNIIDAKSQLEAGNLRALSIYGKERIARFPNVPTFEEYGYIVRCNAVRGVMTPPGVPKERMEILNAAFAKAAANQKFARFVENSCGTALSISLEKAVQFLDEQRKAYVQIAALESKSP